MGSGYGLARGITYAATALYGCHSSPHVARLCPSHSPCGEPVEDSRHEIFVPHYVQRFVLYHPQSTAFHGNVVEHLALWGMLAAAGGRRRRATADVTRFYCSKWPLAHSICTCAALRPARPLGPHPARSLGSP